MFKTRTFGLLSVLVLFSIILPQAFTTIGIELDESSVGIANTSPDISKGSLYRLEPSYAHSFLRPFENGLFPVWVEFIHYLDNEVKQKNFTQISIDPDFAFSFDMVSQGPTDRYKDLLLKHVSTNHSVSTVGLVNVSEGVNFGDISSVSTKSKESWDAVLYYPRKFKQSISDKNKKKPNASATIPSDEEDSIFDILELFKKWGFPKPLTVVFLVIAVYSILAFLVRK